MQRSKVLFNDAPNTFYLRLYGVGHMIKDHSDYFKIVYENGKTWEFYETAGAH